MPWQTTWARRPRSATDIIATRSLSTSKKTHNSKDYNCIHLKNNKFGLIRNIVWVTNSNNRSVKLIFQIFEEMVVFIQNGGADNVTNLMACNVKGAEMAEGFRACLKTFLSYTVGTQFNVKGNTTQSKKGGIVQTNFYNCLQKALRKSWNVDIYQIKAMDQALLNLIFHTRRQEPI